MSGHSGLDLLCITKGERHARQFIIMLRNIADLLGARLVIGADGQAAADLCEPYADRLLVQRSQGYLESVINQAVECCQGEYVLRIDDDELPSMGMVEWLQSGAFVTWDAWLFARMNLWGDGRVFVANDPLWPDMQMRLARRELSGGWCGIHSRCPAAERAVFSRQVIVHYKFLVRSMAEREQMAARYDALRPGAGSGPYRAYTLPEQTFEQLELRSVGAVGVDLS